MAIKILQINAQRSKSVASEIRRTIETNKIDVLVVQEPYVYRNKVKGYAPITARVVQNQENMDSKSAIIVYNDSVTVTQLEQFRTEYIVCAHLSSPEHDFYIVSVYCQFSLEVEDYLLQLDDIIEKLGRKKIIIAGDFNAKSRVWFNDETDFKGEKVEEFLIENNLHILNRSNNPPTFWTINGQSNIDLTLVTNDMKELMENWRVEEDWANSDHNCICFQLNHNMDIHRKRVITKETRYNIKSANWLEFENMIKREFNEKTLTDMQQMNPNKCIDVFNTMIHKVCSRSIKKKINVERKVPWWSQMIEEKRRAVNKSKRKIKVYKRQNRELERKQEESKFKILIKEYKNEIRKSKIESWKNFVTEVAEKDVWGTAYKLTTGKLKRPETYHTIRKDTTYTTDWMSSVEEILKSLAPEDLKQKENIKHENMIEQCNSYTNSNMEPQISIQEINESIKKTKDKKAPGLDNLNPEIVKKVWQCDTKILQMIFNKCFENEAFPQQWKRANLVIFLKSLDRDPSNVGSYRPISLLSVVGKVYERIILNRLMAQYVNSNLASQNQFGFKPGMSTEDALYKMVLNVRSSDKKYVIGVFMDIKGAFDNLWWYSILHRVSQTKCSTRLFNIIRNYFSDRELIVTAGKEIIIRKMSKGCPQGSILGPMIWNIVMDQFLNNETDGCEYIAYADDLLIMISGNSRTELEKIARLVFTKLMNWTNENKLEVSTEKTKAIMLKGNFDRERLPNLKYNNEKIKYFDSLKYLGVIVDKQLNFVQHAKYIKGKIRKICIKFKKIAQEDWGINTKSLKIIYNSLIISIFTYAAGAWFGQTKHTHVRRQLDSAQRFALLTISKACRRVSTTSLQVITGYPPIDLVITERGLNYLLRTRKVVKSDIYEIPLTIQDMNKKQITEEKSKVHKKIYNVWQERWNNETKGKTTHQFIPDVKFAEENRKWFHPGRNITYLITEHGPFNNGLYKLNRNITRHCELCADDEIEDLRHVLFGCEQYAKLRKDNELEQALERAETTQEYALLINKEAKYKKLSHLAENIFKHRKETLNARSRNGSPPRGGDGNAI